VANDPKNNNAALSTAALGPSSEDLQWQLSNGNLVGSWRRRGFVYKFEVRASGASCDAAVSYAFSPGKTSFELIRRINQEKMNVRSMSADRIICRVVQGDAILNSPTAGR
jgi:hypothetical protein